MKKKTLKKEIKQLREEVKNAYSVNACAQK